MKTNSAQHYDLVYNAWIGPDKTKEEISLIEQLTPSGSSILDIGSGTGRHLIPLKQKQYQVFGLDSSEEMTQVLKSKDPQIEILPFSLLEQKKDSIMSTKFNLVLCMWNTVFEVALEQRELDNFFESAANLLTPNGVLLINTTDADDFEPQTEDFVHMVEHQSLEYKMTWKLLDYNPETSTTVAEEQLIVSNRFKQKTQESRRLITQRHWRHDELVDTAERFGFVCNLVRLSSTEDKYFIFRKKRRPIS